MNRGIFRPEFSIPDAPIFLIDDQIFQIVLRYNDDDDIILCCRILDIDLDLLVLGSLFLGFKISVDASI